MLDLILVSEDLIYEICDPIECIFKKSIHHSPIVIDLAIIEFYNYRLSKIDAFTLDFKKANFIGLNNLLLSLDWTFLLSNMDLNAMYEKILSILHNEMNRFIPRKCVHKNNNPVWFNKRLANLKNKKNKIYKKHRLD